MVVGAVIGLSILTAGIGTAVAGALGGGVLATIVGGAVGGAISGAIFGAGISIASQGLSNGYGNVNWGEVGIATLIGAGSGAIMGALTSGLKIAQAAKLWDKGTFKSGFQSMRYHYKTHVVNQGFSKGNNIVKYTNRAVDFMNKNASNLKYTYSSKYNMVRWIGKDSSATGFYTTLGKIITFIIKDSCL